VVYRGNSIEVNVQLALRKRGYYSGPIDGDIGPGTQAAIRAYQRDHNMRASGTIGNSLLDRLGL
jgi:peptidoglycan hydrolase-like protein with peptidoglycan-binding domain